MSNNLYELREEVKKKLATKLEITNTRLYGEKLFKCPFCYSVRRPWRGNFYINEDFTYHCFRCGAHGSVNYLFKLLNIDYKIPDQLIFVKRKNQIDLINNNITRKYYHSYTKKQKIRCLKYLYWRVGIKPSDNIFKYIKDYIVYNPLDLIESDAILKNKISENIKKLLRQYPYIGFTTYNHKQIILRRISKGSGMEFEKFTFNKHKFDQDYFMIITKKIDELFLSESPINVVMGEGVFDILGFLKINENNPKKYDIYIASRGISNMTNTLKYLFFNLINKFNLTILVDKDALPKCKKIIKMNKNILDKSILVYNDLSKDFGDIGHEKYKTKMI